MTRFWWVRHGPTHAKAMVGWSEVAADLSDHAALARLSAALPAEALILSSDLGRAVTTADALRGVRRRLPHDRDLREMHFGAWEMRSHAEVEAEAPELIRAFWESPGEVRPPGGEAWDEVTERVGRATDRLIDAHPGRDIIVVAHFGAILAALQRAAGIGTEKVFGHRIEPLSVTVLEWRPEGWTVGQVNHRP